MNSLACCWLDYVVGRVIDKVRPQDQSGHMQPTAVTIEKRSEGALLWVPGVVSGTN